MQILASPYWLYRDVITTKRRAADGKVIALEKHFFRGAAIFSARRSTVRVISFAVNAIIFFLFDCDVLPRMLLSSLCIYK